MQQQDKTTELPKIFEVSSTAFADPSNKLKEFHPIADLFPLMNSSEFEVFCADISANGLREEIWLHDQKIIDGRNRFRACLQTKTEPRFRYWDGQGDLTAFVVSLNLKRRHLSESQRAMVAQKLANLGSGRPSETTQNCGVISQIAAATMLNVSPRLVSSARKIANDGVPELKAMVEAGDMEVSAAVEIAALPKARQKKIIKKGRNSVKKTIFRIKERSLKNAAGRKRFCLCSENIQDTDEQFLAMIQILSSTFPKHSRFLIDIESELAESELLDETHDHRDRLLDAIDRGITEINECRRSVGLSQDEFDAAIAVLIDYRTVEIYFQGGKTDNARGARKKLLRRMERELTYELYEDDGDEFLDLP